MTSPGYCCYGCWRKGNGLSKSASARRHYHVCEHRTVGPSFVPHVTAMDPIYHALNRRRSIGIQRSCQLLALFITRDDQRTELTFVIHGMEPELPTDMSHLDGALHDPRYPD